MEARDCTRSAPSFYVAMMHNFHFVSFPIYAITLYFLFRDSSNLFRTYKYFMIVHIIINLISETYVTFFMLPMTYLPQPLLRNTGWLADWGFSGMFCFYGLAQLVMATVGSILEMFYYRFKLTSVHMSNNKFRFWLKLQVYLYRILILFHPILASATIKFSLDIESLETMKIWKKNPTLPPEITCYSVIVAIYDDYLVYLLLLIYGIQVVLQFSVSNGVLISTQNIVRMATVMSSSTAKLQKMMIFSLFIQGGIHGLMIMLPTIFMMYALVFNSALNDVALGFFMCVAYHGFMSTCAMIVFTKPLRDKIIPCLKPKPSQTEPRIVSNIVSSSTPRG